MVVDMGMGMGLGMWSNYGRDRSKSQQVLDRGSGKKGREIGSWEADAQIGC